MSALTHEEWSKEWRDFITPDPGGHKIDVPPPVNGKSHSGANSDSAKTPAESIENEGSVTVTAHDVFQEPPTDSLPTPVPEITRSIAQAAGCHPAMVLTMLLPALGSAVGSRRTIEVTPAWNEHSMIFALALGESGSGKTPAHNAIIAPFAEVERGWIEQAKNEEPRELLLNDATMESVIDVMQANPGGLLMHRDEGKVWISGFDRYRKGGKTDMQNWCSVWSAQPFKVHRRTSDPIRVQRANVSISMGIQPDLLARVLDDDAFDGGLLPRILMAWPPERRTSMRQKRAAGRARSETLLTLVRALLSIPHDDNPTPMTPDAVDIFDKWCDAADDRARECDDKRRRGLIQKSTNYVPRVALLFHCIGIANVEIQDDAPVDATAILQAIEIVEWFERETWRCWRLLTTASTETESSREIRRLIELIQSEGGSITPRQLQRRRHKYRARVELAESALQSLVDLGLGEWVHRTPTSNGGAPSHAFHLSPGPTDGDSDRTQRGESESGELAPSPLEEGEA